MARLFWIINTGVGKMPCFDSSSRRLQPFFDGNSRRLQSVCSCGISREQVSDVHPGHISDYTHPWIAGGSHHSHQPEQDSPHCLLHRQVRALLLHIEGRGCGGLCVVSDRYCVSAESLCGVCVITHICVRSHILTYTRTHHVGVHFGLSPLAD